jgi:Putative zinc-finger
LEKVNAVSEMACKQFAEWVDLWLYGELKPAEIAAFEAHRKECAPCAARLEQTQRLHAVWNQRPVLEPSPELLYESRNLLHEVLDSEELGWRGLLHHLFSPWHLAPASAALAVVLLVGLGASMGWELRARFAGAPEAVSPSVDTASVNGGGDLDNMRINKINDVAPGPNKGEVRVTLDAARRMTLEGSLDDPRIQQVLVYALRSYSNPGIRRDTVDALRNHADDPSVRQALLYALRQDGNAGVRLGALDAIRNLPWGPDVRKDLLEALKQDKNPGVRVETVDLLVNRASEDPEVRAALGKLAVTDSNRYVRLKCASAIRRLGEVQQQP